MNQKAKKILKMIKNRKDRSLLYNKKEYWDEEARNNDGSSVSMWPNKSLNQMYHESLNYFLGNFFSDVNGLKILDVGCGTGRLSREFSKRGASVKGIDFSELTLDVARRESRGHNIQFEQKSVFDLDETDFDIVIVSGVLTVACSNENDLSEALKRVINASKKEGKILIIEPIHNSFLSRVLRINRSQFLMILNHMNVKIEYVDGLYFWPIRILLCYIDIPKQITEFFYYQGEKLLNNLDKCFWGDYFVVVLSKKTNKIEVDN